MKELISFIVFSLTIIGVYASTEASNFAEKQYSAQIGNENVHIIVKKEHTMEYLMPVGTEKISAVTYGYGDMKVKGCTKCRITYICLLGENFKPVWSYIIPSK